MNRPETIVWTATLKLRPEAAARVRSLGRGLAPEAQILISADREPLDVTFARLVGQMMSVGEFPSREELVRALGKYAVVEEEVDEEIEVFSPEELAAKRRRAELLKKSDRVLRETEKIRKLAAEGRITYDEAMERLNELRREDTAQ